MVDRHEIRYTHSGLWLHDRWNDFLILEPKPYSHSDVYCFNEQTGWERREMPSRSWYNPWNNDWDYCWLPEVVRWYWKRWNEETRKRFLDFPEGCNFYEDDMKEAQREIQRIEAELETERNKADPDYLMANLRNLAAKAGKTLPEDAEILDFERMGERVRKAYHVARDAHRGQTDKAGRNYILHPMKVASVAGPEEDAVIVALLHDVMEDTDITASQMKDMDFLTSNELYALRRLTRREKKPYAEYIRGVKKSELATKVKLADLMHNADLRRLPRPTRKDMARAWKYLQSIRILLGELRVSDAKMDEMLQ